MTSRASSLLAALVVFLGTATERVFADMPQPTPKLKIRKGRPTVTVSDADGTRESEFSGQAGKRWESILLSKKNLSNDKGVAKEIEKTVSPEKQESTPTQSRAGAPGAALQAVLDSAGNETDELEMEKNAKHFSNSDITLEDGRKLPFGALKLKPEKSRKMVDESVDDYNTLRNFGRTDDNLGDRRYDSASWSGETRAEFADRENPFRHNLLDWQSRVSAWGVKRTSSLDTTSTYETRLRDMPLHVRERRELERRSSAWEKEMASLRDNTLQEQRKASGFFTTNLIFPLQAYTNQMRDMDVNFHHSVSMMNINRYSFRRTRPTTSGLPTIAPGGDLSPDRIQQKK